MRAQEYWVPTGPNHAGPDGVEGHRRLPRCLAELLDQPGGHHREGNLVREPLENARVVIGKGRHTVEHRQRADWTFRGEHWHHDGVAHVARGHAGSERVAAPTHVIFADADVRAPRPATHAPS